MKFILKCLGWTLGLALIAVLVYGFGRFNIHVATLYHHLATGSPVLELWEVAYTSHVGQHREGPWALLWLLWDTVLFLACVLYGFAVGAGVIEGTGSEPRASLGIVAITAVSVAWAIGVDRVIQTLLF